MGRMERDRFESLTMAVKDDLYRFALLLTGNDQDALDLTQETYLKAFRNFDSFKDGTNIRAWMTRIMKNAYIDWHRRKRHEPARLDFDEQSPEPAVESVDEAAITDALPDEIGRAFQELDAASRAILLLCDVQGYRYKEIAEILDIPLGTVMSRLYRARTRLRAAVVRFRKQNKRVDGRG